MGGEDRDESALAVAGQDNLRKLLAVAKVADQRRRIVDVILEAEVFGVAELRSASFFSVAGLTLGPLPSWSMEPEPAIRSATGGRSISGGTVR